MDRLHVYHVSGRAMANGQPSSPHVCVGTTEFVMIDDWSIPKPSPTVSGSSGAQRGFDFRSLSHFIHPCFIHLVAYVMTVTSVPAVLSPEAIEMSPVRRLRYILLEYIGQMSC